MVVALCWLCGHGPPVDVRRDWMSFSEGYVEDSELLQQVVTTQTLQWKVVGLALVEEKVSNAGVLTSLTVEQRFLYNLYGRHGNLAFWEVKHMRLLDTPVEAVALVRGISKHQLFSLHPSQVTELLQQMQPTVDEWARSNPSIVQTQPNTCLQVLSPILTSIMNRNWTSLVVGFPLLRTWHTKGRAGPDQVGKFRIDKQCHLTGLASVRFLQASSTRVENLGAGGPVLDMAGCSLSA
eukprot:12416766-Karenia_brevis.AAC.1